MIDGLKIKTKLPCGACWVHDPNDENVVHLFLAYELSWYEESYDKHLHSAEHFFEIDRRYKEWKASRRGK